RRRECIAIQSLPEKEGGGASCKPCAIASRSWQTAPRELVTKQRLFCLTKQISRERDLFSPLLGNGLPRPGQSVAGTGCKAEGERRQTRPRAVFVAASRTRLAFHNYPRCRERAVIFEEEVSVHIIEVLSESPRVTLAIATNRDDQVFVPVAAWRA